MLPLITIALFLIKAVTAELCSPNDGKCLATSLQDLMPTLSKGIPKMEIFPLDPLYIPILDLSDKPGKLLNVKHKFFNVNMTGLHSASIKAVRANLKKTELNIELEMAEPVILTGTYESQGKILTLPVKGDGPFNITLFGVKASLLMKGHKETQNGKTHIKIDKARFPFAADKMIVDFKDLLKGNKEISEVVNSVLNENWKPVLDDMKESFGDGIAGGFQEFSNRAFKKIPLNELVQV